MRNATQKRALPVPHTHHTTLALLRLRWIHRIQTPTLIPIIRVIKSIITRPSDLPVPATRLRPDEAQPRIIRLRHHAKIARRLRHRHDPSARPETEDSGRGERTAVLWGNPAHGMVRCVTCKGDPEIVTLRPGEIEVAV